MDRSETPRASQQPRYPTGESASRKAKNRSRSGSEELSQIVAQAQANARASRYGNGFAPLQDAVSRPESATPTPYSVRNGGNVELQQARVTSPGLLGWVRNALMLGPSGRVLPMTAEQQQLQQQLQQQSPSSLPSSDPVKRNQTPLLPGILPSFHNVNKNASRDDEARSPLSERSLSSSSIGQESIEAYDRRNRRASSMSTDSSASVYDHGSVDGHNEDDNSDAEDIYAPYAQRQHGPSLVRPTARREALGFVSTDDPETDLASATTNDASISLAQEKRSHPELHALSISEAQGSTQYVVDQSDRVALPDLVISPDPSNRSREVSQSPLAGWFDAPHSKTPKPRAGQDVELTTQQDPRTPSQLSFTTDGSLGDVSDFRTADEEMARRGSGTMMEGRRSSDTYGVTYMGDGEDLNDQLGRPKSPEELIRSRKSRESVVLGSRGATARAGGSGVDRAARRSARESSGLERKSERIDEAEENDGSSTKMGRTSSLGGADKDKTEQQGHAHRPATSTGPVNTIPVTPVKRGLFGRRRIGNVSEPGRQAAADAWDESDTTTASEAKSPIAGEAKSFWRSAKKGQKQVPSAVASTDVNSPSTDNSVVKTPGECSTASVCTSDSWAKRKQTRGALDAAMHPRKVKVRSRNKPSKERDFARLYLAQEIFLAPSDRTAVSPATPAASPRMDEDVESFGHQSTTAKPDGGDTGNEGKVEGGTANKRRATWAMRFSLDGQYLAVAGQDAVIRVYAVLSTPDARQRALFETYESAGCMSISAHNRSATDSTAVNSSLECERKDGKTNSASGGDLPHLLVFSQKPVREFRGHTSDILDLSWSKGGFLLSAGMDKTARVWHMSKPSSLVAFKHGDFVTSVVFHPRDDRFFLSGSLDGKLRLWNISTKRVQASQEIPGLITACAFTHSGKTACVGTFSGAALFYHTEDLVFLSSVAVRSPTGKYQKGGRKITAIEPILPDAVTVDEDSISKTGRDAKKAERERVLITSNDSRVRAYDLANNTIVARFKARSYNNRSSQIKATMSDDNVYVVAGSEATSGNEGGQVHIWECSSILFEGSTRSMLAKLASTGMSAMTNANQRTTGLLRSAAKAGGGAAVPNEKELEKVMQKSKNRSATTADSVVEYFTAHAGTVTCAIMAPLRTNTLLRQANDPILVRTEEKLKHSRLAGSGNLAEMLAGVPINIGRGLAYAIQTPLRAVNHATRHGSGGTDTPPKDSTSVSAENNEMGILNRKLNRIILTVDDNAIVRVWRSDSLQTV